MRTTPKMAQRVIISGESHAYMDPAKVRMIWNREKMVAVKMAPIQSIDFNFVQVVISGFGLYLGKTRKASGTTMAVNGRLM